MKYIITFQITSFELDGTLELIPLPKHKKRDRGKRKRNLRESPATDDAWETFKLRYG